jgi:hypothetical protein
MTATVLYMSMSLDGYIAGPKFREAVPISEVRHLVAPIEPRRKRSNQCRSPPFSPLSPSPMLELRLFRGRLFSNDSPKVGVSVSVKPSSCSSSLVKWLI